jgi:hypothetical protein
MRGRLFAVALVGAALALSAGGAWAQLLADGLRDVLPPAADKPVSYWTPAALKNALMEEPIRGGTLPRGFGVNHIESRRPTRSERAAGMTYRVDVVLSGPYKLQSLSYRMYDTIEAAAAAGDNKTLADTAVTLTSETLAAPMMIALPSNRAGRCARVRSAAFADLVFMRCHAAYAGLPVVVSGTIGTADASLTDSAGVVDMQRLEIEKQTPTALLRTGLAQLDALTANDPTGERAYTRDNVDDGEIAPAPR